jgi:hypothetical protein
MAVRSGDGEADMRDEDSRRPTGVRPGARTAGPPPGVAPVPGPTGG